MAACDNLYGNKAQWNELRKFLLKGKPEYLAFMRPWSNYKGSTDVDEIRICYIAEIQGWLYENCEIDWVKEKLKENFEVQEMILGKAHHERGDEECH